MYFNNIYYFCLEDVHLSSGNIIKCFIVSTACLLLRKPADKIKIIVKGATVWSTKCWINVWRGNVNRKKSPSFDTQCASLLPIYKGTINLFLLLSLWARRIRPKKTSVKGKFHCFQRRNKNYFSHSYRKVFTILMKR